jgi:5-bromo-4-chloroindolyl phosphate hydrolysis protein
MISKERMEELEHYFWSETNDEETQEWRKELSEEEYKLIDEWDKQANTGMKTLFKELAKNIKK